MAAWATGSGGGGGEAVYNPPGGDGIAKIGGETVIVPKEMYSRTLL